jgi:hypothetical protein
VRHSRVIQEDQGVFVMVCKRKTLDHTAGSLRRLAQQICDHSDGILESPISFTKPARKKQRNSDVDTNSTQHDPIVDTNSAHEGIANDGDSHGVGDVDTNDVTNRGGGGGGANDAVQEDKSGDDSGNAHSV